MKFLWRSTTFHYISTRSLGALRALTFSWRPLGPFDFILRTLPALRTCDQRRGSNIFSHIYAKIEYIPSYICKDQIYFLIFLWKLDCTWAWPPIESGKTDLKSNFLFHSFSYFSRQSKTKKIRFQIFLATLRFSWIKMDSVTSAPISKN